MGHLSYFKIFVTLLNFLIFLQLWFLNCWRAKWECRRNALKKVHPKRIIDLALQDDFSPKNDEVKRFLRPRKITWNLKMEPSNRRDSYWKPTIFRFYVKFRGSRKSPWKGSNVARINDAINEKNAHFLKGLFLTMAPILQFLLSSRGG